MKRKLLLGTVSAVVLAIAGGCAFIGANPGSSGHVNPPANEKAKEKAPPFGGSNPQGNGNGPADSFGSHESGNPGLGK